MTKLSTEIAGNNAVVNQDGELDVSGGGHGIDITGDSATVDNKGGMTVADADSIGIQIDGDKAVVNNDGDNAISKLRVMMRRPTTVAIPPLTDRVRPGLKSRVITRW
ncbi:hypothetical protein BA882_07355 [Escherichia coli]|nr:hypothetical protein BA882_07355 [Escherichia coli]